MERGKLGEGEVIGEGKPTKENKIFMRGEVVRNQKVNSQKVEIAREFRKKSTPSEELVWSIIRNRKILGLKWRRQQIIDGFITDFFCAEFNIALEIDGEIHDNADVQETDLIREQVFAQKGIRTIRINNQECNVNHITKAITDTISPSLSTMEREGLGVGEVFGEGG